MAKKLLFKLLVIKDQHVSIKISLINDRKKIFVTVTKYAIIP